MKFPTLSPFNFILLLLRNFKYPYLYDYVNNYFLKRRIIIQFNLII